MFGTVLNYTGICFTFISLSNYLSNEATSFAFACCCSACTTIARVRLGLTCVFVLCRAPLTYRASGSMQQSCAMAMPLNPTSQSRPIIPKWDVNEARGQVVQMLRDNNFSHPYLFIPRSRRDDAWLSVLHASQHPATCSRYLLVEDDLSRAGLGFTGRILASVLLYAARHGRVLLELPARNETTGEPSGRWCDRDPHTLQCAFEPWSHCPLPDARLRAAAYETTCTYKEHANGTRLTMNFWSQFNCFRNHVKRDKGAVRIRLSSFYRIRFLWQRQGPDEYAVLRAAHRLLFVPRPWVTSLAACVMKKRGLRSAEFMTVHVRVSEEKRIELSKAGKLMPNEAAYRQLTQLAAEASGLRHIFLQTANPRVLSEWIAWVVTQNLTLGYTENPRQEGDAWGGWSDEANMTSTQLAVAAVNAYIASRAALLISPADSMWTAFLVHLLGFDTHAEHWLPVRAPPNLPWLDEELDDSSYKCGAFEGSLTIVARRSVIPWAVVSNVANKTARVSKKHVGCLHTKLMGRAISAGK